MTIQVLPAWNSAEITGRTAKLIRCAKRGKPSIIRWAYYLNKMKQTHIKNIVSSSWPYFIRHFVSFYLSNFFLQNLEKSVKIENISRIPGSWDGKGSIIARMNDETSRTKYSIRHTSRVPKLSITISMR